jgi:hypothetical protein
MIWFLSCRRWYCSHIPCHNAKKGGTSLLTSSNNYDDILNSLFVSLSLIDKLLWTMFLEWIHNDVWLCMSFMATNRLHWSIERISTRIFIIHICTFNTFLHNVCIFCLLYYILTAFKWIGFVLYFCTCIPIGTSL